VGIGVGVAPQVLGFVFGPNRPDAAKNSPYECGFEPSKTRDEVRRALLLVAISSSLRSRNRLLFPWAVALKESGRRLLGDDGLLDDLVVGFIYEWKKGALDWE
jgi:NADH-quinone oxidoreductase subunit A